jgi:16S rRNA G966 N2-methylase RsmD
MSKLSQKTFVTDDQGGPVECLGMTFPNDQARRDYFLGKLREKLKEPEFRKIEGFPSGEDEDILAISDPPYFTACPNPFLEEFLKRYGRPYDPAEQHIQEPFAADVSEGKHDPVYKAHTYHTKVPPKAILRYLEHFTRPGDVILDPYCGSGMTGVAARLLGGRHVIECDLSPAATHISWGYATSWDIKRFNQAADSILHSAQDKYRREYSAIDKNTPVGNVKYWVWTDVLNCNSCNKSYSFADVAVDLTTEYIAGEYACPHCGSDQSKASANYAHESVYDPYLKRPINWNKRQPFWIVYEVGGRRVKRNMNSSEISESTRPPDRKQATHFPTVPFMFREGRWGCLFRSGYHYGMTHSHHFYTWRNLAMLDDIWEQIERSEPRLRHMLRFWFLATAIKCSKLMTYNADGIGRVTKGNLYVSSLIQEVNPVHFLEITRRDMASALAQLNTPSSIVVSTNSASSLPIPDASIDYVFVDPPFGDNLIYSELNWV